MATKIRITYRLGYTEPFSGNYVEKCDNVNFSSGKKFQKSVLNILETVEPGTHFTIKRYIEIREPGYKLRKSGQKTTVWFGNIDFWVMNYQYTMADLQQQAVEHGKIVDFFPSVMPQPENPAVISYICDNKAFCNNLTPNHIIVDRNLCDLRTFSIPAKIVQFLERPQER